MEFGLDIAQQRMPFDEVVSRARFAEDVGFTGVWGFDHFVPMYGEGPGECFDGMTTLAALSSATTSIRLGLMVAGVTYRHPSVFANQCLTIDHASHGRLDIGLGNAWFEAEHRALGIDFPSTWKRTSHNIQAGSAVSSGADGVATRTPTRPSGNASTSSPSSDIR